MPPGEAMTMGVPFIATSYELYHDIYGSKGAIAPLLPIDQTSSPEDPIPEAFVNWTMRMLTDGEYRTLVVTRNLDVVRRYFSMESLGLQLGELFGAESQADDCPTDGV
jgi:hypothetical protein